MSKALDFFMSMPVLCGAQNAERWAEIIKFQYEKELMDKSSVWAQNGDDIADPVNRLETAFAWKAKDEGKKKHCENLSLLMVLAHRMKEHGDTSYEPFVEELKGITSANERFYPDVAAMMSVEDASQGTWTP